MIEQGIIDPVVKVGNLDSLRTIADVRDAVRAYHMLVTINPIKGSYYNIGGSESLTIREVLDFLISKSTFKQKIDIIVEKERIREIDADLQVPDTSKFTSHTGWKPEIGYKTTLTDLLDYWRDKVTNSNSGFLTR